MKPGSHDASTPRVAQGSHGAMVLLAVLALLAIAAPWLAPYDPVAQLDLAGLKNGLPSRAHPLGTDAYSRDLLSRLLFGARTSLLVAATATASALVIGTSWGASAALAPPTVGAAMMGITDIARSVPRVLLLLGAFVVFGALSPVAVGALLGVTVWPATSRLVFAGTCALRARPFVEAAHALGTPPLRVLGTHIAPLLRGTLTASGALLFADLLALEAGLSFVGLGVRPPAASWGGMIQDALPYLGSAPWVAVVPCTVLALTVLAVARVADGVRDVTVRARGE